MPRVLMLSLIASASMAEVRLPALFSDRAVMQAGAPLRVWGRASPGERVTVRMAGKEASGVADALGEWSAFLPPLPAGGPHELGVAASNTVTVRDVLIGEVWVASGQSNMAFNMKRESHAAAGIPVARFPRIRFFRVAQKTSPVPLDDVLGSWEETTPEAAANFSAVAYYFARDLHKRQGVPFGVIQSAVGGTPAESWTSGAALTGDPALLPLLSNWQKRLAEYPEAQARFEKEKKAGQQPPPGPGHRWEPAGLYNGMIAPLTRYAIRGAIWYQGENNAGRGHGGLYRRLFETMIRDWRSAWAQGDFPFLWVQLPKFIQRAPGASWPELQQAQRDSLALRNTGMAVILDAGNLEDVHPTDKLIPGTRLARVARGVAYGENIVYSGPLLRQITREGSDLRLWFDHAGSGLRFQGAPIGFAVAGANGSYKAAAARVDGATVVVSAEGIAGPVQVRYGWGGNGEGNLANSEDLPASPFQAASRD